MTLDELIQETLLEAARLKTRARKVPEFAEHIKRLQDIYRGEIAPASQPSMEPIPEHEWEWIEDEGGRRPKARAKHVPPKMSADELYDRIINAWKEAVGHGLSEEEFNKFRSVLDQIRQEWRESPMGPHRMGPHEYQHEQQHLAAYPAQWLTAGLVGSARATEKAPSFGSHEWIWNAPDTGATARAGPGAPGEKGKRGGAAASTAAQAGGEGFPATIHPSSQTLHTSMGPITPAHFRGKGRGRGKTGQAKEDIHRLANLIPEDIDSTWDSDRLLTEDDDEFGYVRHDINYTLKQLHLGDWQRALDALERIGETAQGSPLAEALSPDLDYALRQLRQFRDTSRAYDAVRRMAETLSYVHEESLNRDTNPMIEQDDAGAAAAIGAPAQRQIIQQRGNVNPQATRAFQEADKAAATIKQQLGEIQKTGGLAPDQAKKFMEFGQFLMQAAQGKRPAGGTVR
jgi:hypothetical protein